MNEVELTSEFIILMLNGVTGRSKTQIDRYYGQYEKGFPSATEASVRMRDTFDNIDALFSNSDLAQLFSTVTMFYGIFATLYGLRYGLRTPMSKGFPPGLEKAKSKAVERDVISHILNAGRAVHHEDVPEAVARGLRGATTDTSSRRLLIGFLAGPENDPCPHQNYRHFSTACNGLMLLEPGWSLYW